MQKTIKFNKLFLLILISFYFISTIAEANSNTGADFLKLGVGARASAMGEAFCAIADDIQAIYFNPAGLGYLTKKEISAMYGDKREDTSRTFLAYVQPLEEDEGEGVFGIGFIQQDLGKIELRDKDNIFKGEVNPFEFAVFLSYAKQYDENLSLGWNLKYIHRDLKKLKAKGFAIDLGILYRTQKPLTLGACLENLGSKIKGDELPLHLRVGFAYQLMDNLYCALDFNKRLYDSGLGINIGFEYIYNIFAVRVGYLDKGRKVEGLTYGLGIKYQNYQLDFANVASGDMDGSENVNRISFSVEF